MVVMPHSSEGSEAVRSYYDRCHSSQNTADTSNSDRSYDICSIQEYFDPRLSETVHLIN